MSATSARVSAADTTSISATTTARRPLLGDASSSTSTSRADVTPTRCRCTATRSATATCGALGLLVLVAFVYGAAVGAFTPVSRERPSERNGTVVEPNTRDAYPTEMPGGLGVLGVTLWTYAIPTPGVHPHVRVASVALYVAHDTASRRLRRFKGQGYSPELADAIVKPGMATTMRLTMAGTPPSSSTMLDGWIKDMTPFLREACASEEVVQQERQAFHEAFKGYRFAKGQRFRFERRPTDDALFLIKNDGDDETVEHARVRIGKGSCLSQAFFREKMSVLGKGLTDLLDEFFA